MANHQHFGGVEKKFVIHRASPRDMRTKRETRGGRGRRKGKGMSKSPKAIADLFSANARFLQIRSQLPSGICTKCQSRRERLVSSIDTIPSRVSIMGMRIGREKKRKRETERERKKAISNETFVLIETACAIDCDLSQKERGKEVLAVPIIDL